MKEEDADAYRQIMGYIAEDDGKDKESSSDGTSLHSGTTGGYNNRSGSYSTSSAAGPGSGRPSARGIVASRLPHTPRTGGHKSSAYSPSSHGSARAHKSPPHSPTSGRARPVPLGSADAAYFASPSIARNLGLGLKVNFATVLHTQLNGLDFNGSQLNLKATEQLLTRFMLTVVTQVKAFGGTVVSSNGDTVVAMWKSRTPQDALHCAVTIQGNVDLNTTQVCATRSHQEPHTATDTRTQPPTPLHSH